jgi:type VI secretion system secreted protein Hcp
MPMTSYLTLEGENQGPIEGDCEQSGREKTILVYALDHKVEIPRDTHTGLPTGQRIHHPITITKHIDPASPLIYQACCTGEHLKKFELDFYHINPQGLEELYYKISLEDSIIVTVEAYYPETFLEANKPYLHMERVSFTYSKITWSHETASKEAVDDWKSPAQ